MCGRNLACLIFISVEKIVHTTIEYKNLQCVRRIHAEQTFANRNGSPS